MEDTMRNRRIFTHEQPEVLVDKLGEATVIDDDFFPVDNTSRGVPHGVTKAIVQMQNVRVEGGSVYFCDSDHYCVHQSSLHGADNGPQPPVEASEISTSRSRLPANGYYNVRARVSLNGARKIHVEHFEPAELQAQ
jgi:hypothetical protein